MSRAAEVLSLSSHANISKGIKQLEFELGTKLFNTDSRGVTPTDIGAQLYEIVKPMFSEIDFVEKNIGKLKKRDSVKTKKSGNIHLIMTGGTIDSEFCGRKQDIIPLKQSFVPVYLRDFVSPDIQFHETELTMKDSRDLTEEDLSNLLDVIMESPYENILITHGRYTIGRTAKYLRNFIEKSKTFKKILLVGAQYPIKGSALSDAPFSLGFAVGSFQNVAVGVYVIVQGKIFDADSFVI